MIRARSHQNHENPTIAAGYGTLVSVTPAGPKDAVLWFQDSGGTLRAVRMGLDLSDGLTLSMKGQTVLGRS